MAQEVESLPSPLPPELSEESLQPWLPQEFLPSLVAPPTQAAQPWPRPPVLESPSSGQIDNLLLNYHQPSGLGRAVTIL